LFASPFVISLTILCLQIAFKKPDFFRFCIKDVREVTRKAHHKTHLMSKFLLKNFFIFILLAACNPGHRSASASHELNDHSTNLSQTLPSELVGIDSTGQNDSGAKLLSLMDLPQTEDGEIVLSEGFYEADFKSYCLQPGTPSPSNGDAYRQGPFN
jgi:hypothetical protein